jgi:hypothetical protein
MVSNPWTSTSNLIDCSASDILLLYPRLGSGHIPDVSAALRRPQISSGCMNTAIDDFNGFSSDVTWALSWAVPVLRRHLLSNGGEPWFDGNVRRWQAATVYRYHRLT